MLVMDFFQETSMITLRKKQSPDFKTGNHKLNIFKKHILRTYLQTAVWRSYKEKHPKQFNPTNDEWTRDVYTEMFTSAVKSYDVSSPMHVLKMITCAFFYVLLLDANLLCSVFCRNMQNSQHYNNCGRR